MPQAATPGRFERAETGATAPDNKKRGSKFEPDQLQRLDGAGVERTDVRDAARPEAVEDLGVGLVHAHVEHVGDVGLALLPADMAGALALHRRKERLVVRACPQQKTRSARQQGEIFSGGFANGAGEEGWALAWMMQGSPGAAIPPALAGAAGDLRAGRLIFGGGRAAVVAVLLLSRWPQRGQYLQRHVLCSQPQRQAQDAGAGGLDGAGVAGARSGGFGAEAPSSGPPSGSRPAARRVRCTPCCPSQSTRPTGRRRCPGGPPPHRMAGRRP